MTNRRFFIGPIPEGWLQNHRKSWFKKRLSFKNYSSRTISFAADPVIEHYRDNPPEETDPLSPGPEQDILLTDGTETDEPDNGRDNDQMNKSGEDNAASVSKTLQTIAYPLNETDEVPPPPDSDGPQQTESNPQNPDDASIETKPQASSSFFTAIENVPDEPDDGQPSTSKRGQQQVDNDSQQTLKIPSVGEPSQGSSAISASDAESTQALLKSKPQPRSKTKRSDYTSNTLDEQEPQGEETSENEGSDYGRQADRRFFSPLSNKAAKYNINDNFMDKRRRAHARMVRTQDGIAANRPRRRKRQVGEIIKAEKMLVRVEATLQKVLPDDYNERDSLRMETRLMDKWREFLVVCRKVADEDAPFSLQMYKTRVIPEGQNPTARIKPFYEVHLNRKETRVNLYSSLDKTLVLWRPCKMGTKIYIMRPKSAAHAIEWYTFIGQTLGWERPTSLPIGVPDLDVALIFKNPFAQLSNLMPKDDRGEDNGSLSRAAAEEPYVAQAIIRGCLQMLENRPEWADVLRQWSDTERMGLAWKRYDRLEWVFGVNEKKMYGSMAMVRSHELELRPRQHYPTTVKGDSGNKEDEPPPVEGFLIRLTSQRGVHQRMNKMFFKRLYFFTQDHYLLFSRPSKALPPPPPKLAIEDSNIPSSQDILKKTPLSYDVDPYPLRNGEVTWLSSGNDQFVRDHDEEAYAQAQRNIHNLTQADGYIDLCRVKEVRHVQRGSSPADPNIGEGSDIEFNREQRDTRRDDGATGQFDDDRTFEMLLDNNLVVRLLAYNEVTRDEWIRRLRALVNYWKARSMADAAELKGVRQRNLDLLDIDEDMESIIGQFARKWEVKKAEASPHLHNMCNLLGCRTIKVCVYSSLASIANWSRCPEISIASLAVIQHSGIATSF